MTEFITYIIEAGKIIAIASIGIILLLWIIKKANRTITEHYGISRFQDLAQDKDEHIGFIHNKAQATIENAWRQLKEWWGA